MNTQTIELEAYKLIRKKARDIVDQVDDVTLGSYVRGVVDLQTELYKLSEKTESGDNKQGRCDNCLNNTDELSGECYECVKGIEDWYEPLKENK